VLKLAKARGYKNVLVFEDDFTFLIPKEHFWSLLEQALKEAPNYDVIMLGYNVIQSEEFSPTLMKVLEAQAGSAYLVNETMYDALISVWDEGTKMLFETGEHWLYASDQAWKVLQPHAKWYALTTRVGKQRPSFGNTGFEPEWADHMC
jgi:GR25 family glycosyltransferase involved in LPS biosynthesis